MQTHRLTIAVLCLPLLACYEEPVRDHLHIVFAPGPAIVVTAVREISSPGSSGDNPAVEERMDEARRDLDSGWDRWTRSFAELDAVVERSTLERREGRASRGIHSALLDSFRTVERLLGNEGLGAFYDQTGGVHELQLYPTGAGRATRQQRDLCDRNMTIWAELVAEYLADAGALYAHLDVEPGRAVSCFAQIFEDHPETSGPLSEYEEQLVVKLKDSIESVADALLIDSGHAYSLNELSRLVFDSFQGRLTITVDGPVISLDGFSDRGTHIERPPVDLWRALEAMAGQWLEPDLVTNLVTPGPEDAQPEVDPVAFAALTRRWAQAPDGRTVESELRNRLRPAETYLVRWRTRPVSADEDEILEFAIGILAEAERNLPR